jgi:hypothetical protein
MATYLCHDCQQPVSSEEALLRSVRFERVAFCPGCWEAKHGGIGVPQQRTSDEDARSHQAI